ncbi:DUF2063 domain-containing protein [Burkholderia sp. WAC0059]|uniref:HvfC/BufC family peptide modification chaperone n=1 Tax=Burkholderia sp. WAC0059 TaxID=2066022 RepID=UPI000C7EA74F|nr:putative DNA-binding domain-containing protein [Burkholderia sp. WAC0059]PLZ02262.1 DUF2063 domain-containing protein [Burkholderia sp. WAC0059]
MTTTRPPAHAFDATQRLFAEALDDPAHDAALAECLRPAGSPGHAASSGRASDDASLLRARIGLYRGGVRAARRRALASAYPVLLALAGDAWFDALSIAYARAHPTPDGDLNRFGASLPGFLGDYEPDPRYRYFADVARLEWALHAAAFAADVVPLTPGQWVDLGPARLSGARLVVHPACVALASPYACADLWQAHRPGGAWPPRIDTPSWALVVRPRWRPGVLIQSAAAHAAFVALQRGDTLDTALDEAFALDPEFDFARQWRAWIDAAAIVGLVGLP